MYKNLYELFPNLNMEISFGLKGIFEQERIAFYALLKSIVSHEWGLHVLAQTPSLLYCLDSANERQDKEWRFSILQDILSFSNCKEILGEAWYEQMSIALKHGPYYEAPAPLISMQSS